MNSSVIPAFCAFAAVTLAVLSLVDFVIYVTARYHEKYLREANSELDDILIQMPAGRIFDLGVALAVSGGVITIIVMALRMEYFSVARALLASLIVGALLFPLPRIVLRFIRKRRLEKFNLQLEDALGMMSSALKAGFSINQAIEEIANQDLHPLAVEFRLLVQELRLGVPFEQALDNMCKRLECDDLDLVATAIITARQTGGELTEVLERVATLIRERSKIQRKVKALTAMGRLQALIIGATPYLLLIGLTIVNPGMMHYFLDSPVGTIALIAITLLVIGGFCSIKKITTIEV